MRRQIASDIVAFVSLIIIIAFFLYILPVAA